MHRSVGGKHFISRLPVVATAEVGHFTAGLHQDQGACRYIPGTDPGFDTRFETSGGDIADFGSRRSHQARSSGETV